MTAPIARQASQALRGLASRGASMGDLLREAARHLAASVPHDGWCCLLIDPSTLVMTGGIHEHGLTPDAIRRLLEIEYGEGDLNLFVDLARARVPAAGLADTAGSALALERSPRWRDVLAPSGYGDELRVVLRNGGAIWGALVLFRARGKPAFTKEDAAAAATIAEPAAEALRGALLRAASVDLAVLADRGVLVLDAGNRIESATPEAERLLADLAEEGPADPANVPHVVQAIAIEARAAFRERGERDAGAAGAAPAAMVSRSRARTRSGQWATLHATGLAPDAERVVVYIEPSRPMEIASLILRAYGLSKREGELVRLVLHGLDTEQIADALGISPWTVQDHLKSIFDKVGVSSRKELVARVFFTHYLPNMESPIAPDGWFAEPSPPPPPKR